MEPTKGVGLLRDVSRGIQRLTFFADSLQRSIRGGGGVGGIDQQYYPCSQLNANNQVSRQELNEEWIRLLKHDDILVLISEICSSSSSSGRGFSSDEEKGGDRRIFWPGRDSTKRDHLCFVEGVENPDLDIDTICDVSDRVDLDEELCYKYHKRIVGTVAEGRTVPAVELFVVFFVDTTGYLNALTSLLLFERQYAHLLDVSFFDFANSSRITSSAAVDNPSQGSYTMRENCIRNLLSSIEYSYSRSIVEIHDSALHQHVSNFCRLCAQLLLVITSQEKSLIDPPGYFMGSDENVLRLINFIESISLHIGDDTAISSSSPASPDSSGSNAQSILSSSLLVICIICFMNVPTMAMPSTGAGGGGGGGEEKSSIGDWSYTNTNSNSKSNSISSISNSFNCNSLFDSRSSGSFSSMDHSSSSLSSSQSSMSSRLSRRNSSSSSIISSSFFRTVYLHLAKISSESSERAAEKRREKKKKFADLEDIYGPISDEQYQDVTEKLSQPNVSDEDLLSPSSSPSSFSFSSSPAYRKERKYSDEDLVHFKNIAELYVEQHCLHSNYVTDRDINGALGALYLILAVTSPEYSERCLKQLAFDNLHFKEKKDASSMRGYSFVRGIVLRMILTSNLLVDVDSSSTASKLQINDIIFSSLHSFTSKSLRTITLKCRQNVSIFHDPTEGILCDTLYDFFSMIRDTYSTLIVLPLPVAGAYKHNVNVVECYKEFLLTFRWNCEESSYASDSAAATVADNLTDIRVALIRILAMFCKVGNCEYTFEFLKTSRKFWLNDFDIFNPIISGSRYINACSAAVGVSDSSNSSFDVEADGLSFEQNFSSGYNVLITDAKLELIVQLFSKPDLYDLLSKEYNVAFEDILCSFINIKLPVVTKGLIYEALNAICLHSNDSVCRRILGHLDKKKIIFDNTTSTAKQKNYPHGLVVGVALKYDIAELEMKEKMYPITVGFLNLFTTLLSRLSRSSKWDINSKLGEEYRPPGICPYAHFIIFEVLFSCDKWGFFPDAPSDNLIGVGYKYEVINSCLKVLALILSNYRIEMLEDLDIDGDIPSDLGGELLDYLNDFLNNKTTELIISGEHMAMRRQKSPGFTLMAMILGDDKEDGLLEFIVRLLDRCCDSSDQMDRTDQITAGCLQLLQNMNSSDSESSYFSIDSCVLGNVGYWKLETAASALRILNLVLLKEPVYVKLMQDSLSSNGREQVVYSKFDPPVIAIRSLKDVRGVGVSTSDVGLISMNQLAITLIPSAQSLGDYYHICLFARFFECKLNTTSCPIDDAFSSPASLAASIIKQLATSDLSSVIADNLRYSLDSNPLLSSIGLADFFGEALSSGNLTLTPNPDRNVECSFVLNENSNSSRTAAATFSSRPRLRGRAFETTEIVTNLILSSLSKDEFCLSHSLLGLENVALVRPPFSVDPKGSRGFVALLDVLRMETYDNTPSKSYILYQDPPAAASALELLYRLIESPMTSNKVLEFIGKYNPTFLIDILRCLLVPINSNNSSSSNNNNCNINSNSSSSNNNNNNNNSSSSSSNIHIFPNDDFKIYWRRSIGSFFDICALILYRTNDKSKLGIPGLNISAVLSILFSINNSCSVGTTTSTASDNESATVNSPFFIVSELLSHICYTESSSITRTTVTSSSSSDPKELVINGVIVQGVTKCDIIIGDAKLDLKDRNFIKRISPFHKIVFDGSNNASLLDDNMVPFGDDQHVVDLYNNEQLQQDASLRAVCAWNRLLSLILDYRFNTIIRQDMLMKPICEIPHLFEQLLLPLSSFIASNRMSPFIAEHLGRSMVRMVTILVNGIVAGGLEFISIEKDLSRSEYLLTQLVHNIILAGCGSNCGLDSILKIRAENTHYFVQLQLCLSKILQTPQRERWSIQSNDPADINTFVHEDTINKTKILSRKPSEAYNLIANAPAPMVSNLKAWQMKKAAAKKDKEEADAVAARSMQTDSSTIESGNTAVVESEEYMSNGNDVDESIGRGNSGRNYNNKKLESPISNVDHQSPRSIRFSDTDDNRPATFDNDTPTTTIGNSIAETTADKSSSSSPISSPSSSTYSNVTRQLSFSFSQSSPTKVSTSTGSEDDKPPKSYFISPDFDPNMYMTSGFSENDRLSLLNICTSSLQDVCSFDDKHSNAEALVQLISSDINNAVSGTNPVGVGELVILSLSVLNDILLTLSPVLPTGISKACMCESIVASREDARYYRGEYLRQKNIDNKTNQVSFVNCIELIFAYGVLHFCVGIIDEVPPWPKGVAVWSADSDVFQASTGEGDECGYVDGYAYCDRIKGHEHLFSASLTLFSHVLASAIGFEKISEIGIFRSILDIPFFSSAPPGNNIRIKKSESQCFTDSSSSMQVDYAISFYFMPVIQFLNSFSSTTITQSGTIGSICLQFIYTNLQSVEHFLSFDSNNRSLLGFTLMEKLTRLLKWSAFHATVLPKDEAIYQSSLPLNELVSYIASGFSNSLSSSSSTITTTTTSQLLLMDDGSSSEGMLADSTENYRLNNVLDNSIKPTCFKLLDIFGKSPLSSAVKTYLDLSYKAQQKRDAVDVDFDDIEYEDLDEESKFWWYDFKPCTKDRRRLAIDSDDSSITEFEFDKVRLCLETLSHLTFFLRSWYASPRCNPDKSQSLIGGVEGLSLGHLLRKDLKTLLVAFSTISDFAAVRYYGRSNDSYSYDTKGMMEKKKKNIYFREFVISSGIIICDNILSILFHATKCMGKVERQHVLGYLEHKEFGFIRAIGIFPACSEVQATYMTLRTLFYVKADDE